MKHFPTRQRLLCIAVALLGATLVSCDRKPQVVVEKKAEVTPEMMADALFVAASSALSIYSNQVVYRLQDVAGVIRASEQWPTEHDKLPLPAQMFRMTSERSAKQSDRFSFALISKWPLRKGNLPRTDTEDMGLETVLANPTKPYYGRETTIDGSKQLTAVYASIATSPACARCHNNHPDSPRTDFKDGDVMGGVVVRIRLN